MKAREAGRAMSKSSENYLRAGDVLKQAGISHQVLYRYVTQGLIEEAGQTEGGQRLYHPRVVHLVERIQGLSSSGYSLRDIKDIFFKEKRVRRACDSGPPGTEKNRDSREPEAQ